MGSHPKPELTNAELTNAEARIAEDIRENAPVRLERTTSRLLGERANQCRHKLDASLSIKCAS